MSTAATAIDFGAELMTPKAAQDPYEIYHRLRAVSPVYWSEAQNAWLVTGYHETRAFLAAHEHFMSDKTRGRNVFKLTPGERELCPQLDKVATTPALSFADPPLHTFHRSLVNRPLSPRQVRGRRRWVVARCEQLVDAMAAKPRPDVVTELAQPLSLSLVVRMFGAAHEHEPLYLDLADRNRHFFGAFDVDWETAMSTESVFSTFADHVDTLVAEKRRAPDDSFLSALVAGASDGRQLTPDELYVMSMIFLGAAFETTIAGISSAIYALLQTGQHALVRADPRRAQAAFSEALRWEAPSHRVGRRARHDIKFCGQRIRQGDIIWLHLAAANRDPEVFADPDRFDIDREPVAHVGFGDGVHFCAGAGIAQMEGVSAISALLDRFPAIRIADDWMPTWSGSKYPSARFLTSLPVELGEQRMSKPSVGSASSALLGRDAVSMLVVARIETLAERVKAIELVRPAGGALPGWEPGAHVALVLPNGLERQYSLCGDPDDQAIWRIAVLREPDGRGGSSWIHDFLAPGLALQVRSPRNNFALVDASAYVFIAGGIGITPLLPMVRELERRSRPWRLHYGGRTRTSIAFQDELAAYGDRVTIHPEDEEGPLDLSAILAAAPYGAAVYCCGPERLIEAVEMHHAPLPPGSLHVERFRPRQRDAGSDSAFEVVAAASGVSVVVQPGQSIVAALARVGVYVPTSCGEGTCGTCESALLSGTPEHRDSVLGPGERAGNSTLMPCCSRAAPGCECLVLDL
jgi:cytochrome P450/ferredoxin-NADP reductase